MDALLLFLRDFLDLLNETLTAAIVIVSVSMLLWTMTRNWHNRVARTSVFVLACVAATYIGDVLISLGPGPGTLEAAQRTQWVGIAFLPAATFHLSDALLATTGHPSRGRRRSALLLLYVVGVTCLLAAAFTDTLVQVANRNPVTLRAAPGFVLYFAYFLVATFAAFVNVQRARERCLTRDTRRRMGYLQIAMLTPPLGIFPFSMVFPIGEENTLAALALVNAANLVVVLMLMFLAYPLSFFGTRIPDRIVKSELLRFMLRGPFTGVLALATILYFDSVTRFLSFSGDSFLPFAVVAVVLLWQWLIDLAIPVLEKRLIYDDEDADQLEKLQTLAERVLTRNDLLQLLEGVLSATCNYLQVRTAFALLISDNDMEVVRAVGVSGESVLTNGHSHLRALLENTEMPVVLWGSYWVAPLYTNRPAGTSSTHIIGAVGVQARATQFDLSTEEWRTFDLFLRRAARILDDLTLQAEVFGALEGLLPQINVTRTRAEDVEFRPRINSALQPSSALSIDREQIIEQVRAALRHYWGGPGLNNSRLLDLGIVRAALVENDNNPVRALRATLQKAIERQRPAGDRRMSGTEWTIYNILDLRFVERHRVLDVAKRMAMSEADLYRKQRIAIEALADTLIELEQSSKQST